MSKPPDSTDSPTEVSPEIDPTLPEPVRRFLAAGASLERIVLDAEGRWSHQGEPFVNDALKALFHRSIGRTPGGTWVLQIPPFTYPIEVEDTPYHVRSVTLAGAGEAERAVLHLSDGTDEDLDPAGLRHVPGRGLYCAVHGGAFAARFNRPAYYALSERLEEQGGRHVLRIAGRAIDLGPAAAPMTKEDKP